MIFFNPCDAILSSSVIISAVLKIIKASQLLKIPGKISLPNFHYDTIMEIFTVYLFLFLGVSIYNIIYETFQRFGVAYIEELKY